TGKRQQSITRTVCKWPLDRCSHETSGTSEIRCLSLESARNGDAAHLSNGRLSRFCIRRRGLTVGACGRRVLPLLPLWEVFSPGSPSCFTWFSPCSDLRPCPRLPTPPTLSSKSRGSPSS